jgi:hypothetical protein
MFLFLDYFCNAMLIHVNRGREEGIPERLTRASRPMPPKTIAVPAHCWDGEFVVVDDDGEEHGEELAGEGEGDEGERAKVVEGLKDEELAEGVCETVLEEGGEDGRGWRWES